VIFKIYTPCLIGFYFLLWAAYSQWSLYVMLFYENNLAATFARCAVAFVLLIAATMALVQERQP
jgi:hypothetical protein